MRREAFVFVCYSDFSGQVRGKGFPLRELEARWERGVGWTPTNIMINCFGNTPVTPWGGSGDLVLRPDPAELVELDFGDDGPVERFVLGDVESLDGSPWAVCPRHYLRSALAELGASFGLRLRASFEHEFTVIGVEPRLGAAYGIEALRSVGDLPEVILAQLDAAELEPEAFHPEFSPGQFEVSVGPALGVEAADRAVKLRQIVRACCERKGWRASFSPIMRKGGVGNGVHIHFSLEDRDGRPATYDPARPEAVSEIAGQFAAGILAHGRALCAVTAPSVISYERLRPNAWSASVTNLGARDREAFLRICPVSEKPEADVGESFNLEYRAADAAATPYLALGAILRAGMDGLRKSMPPRDPLSVIDIARLSDAEQLERGILPLPKSLGEALDCLEASGDLLMPDAVRIPYIMHKRAEIAELADLPPDEVFTRYGRAY
ncbi:MULTISPECIES: glutamine synthetase family protein [Rhodomicrobium]|uniref:glutamine synthetase family protein n=1 Tax=Rhodomicrobium TaxID=1068 RepID=UPI000B4B1F5F|nr:MULTISPECIES: glutamine synthetase family protein [Rhodomicrobium]